MGLLFITILRLMQEQRVCLEQQNPSAFLKRGRKDVANLGRSLLREIVEDEKENEYQSEH